MTAVFGVRKLACALFSRQLAAAAAKCANSGEGSIAGLHMLLDVKNTWTHGNLLTFLGDAYALDLDTLRWRQLRELPAPVWSVSAVAYENRFIILAGGHRRARHDPPDELYDLHRAPEGPNLDVLVYDSELDFYQTLPSKFPAFHITEETRQEIARMRLRNPPSDWTNRFDFSQGGRRVLPGITVVQGRIYVTGSSVDVTEANATDDFLIGTVVR